MKRFFVPFVLAAFFSLGLVTVSAQTAPHLGAIGTKPTAAKVIRVNAFSSSSVDGPPTTDDDGVHVSFTGGVIDRGNPLFDGTISISLTISPAAAPTAASTANARSKVTGVITVGSGKGDHQATVVLEFKGFIKGNQMTGDWKVSGATGIAEGLKGVGKFNGRRTHEGLFLNLLGGVGKP
jgi:hypothetical protein